MTTWPVYLKNSLGVQIFAGVCLLLAMNIMICMIIEKKRISAGLTKDDQKIKSIITMRRLWVGALIGFVVCVAAGVTQFIIRFGYFSLLQEIGVVFLGFIGAIIGAVCGIIKHKKHK